MARIVLTDASPLIGLSIVEGIRWLRPLFGVVWMPPEVRDELLVDGPDRGQAEIRLAMEQGWLRVWTRPVRRIDLPDLDEGESACLRIAVAHGASSLVLMDERAGRAVAAALGVKVAGTAALIGLARQRGLIDSARRVFEVLHRSDFRISAEVIRMVLTRVGE